tara:strand:+ start:142 stop:351 length:210 start_codon:yes stop_codon:yes gene_type:complete
MDKYTKILILLCVFNLGMLVAFKIALYQPLNSHTEAVNRFLNWPKKECYMYMDIEQILYGSKKPTYEYK